MSSTESQKLGKRTAKTPTKQRATTRLNQNTDSTAESNLTFNKKLKTKTTIDRPSPSFNNANIGLSEMVATTKKLPSFKQSPSAGSTLGDHSLETSLVPRPNSGMKYSELLAYLNLLQEQRTWYYCPLCNQLSKSNTSKIGHPYMLLSKKAAVLHLLAQSI